MSGDKRTCELSCGFFQQQEQNECKFNSSYVTILILFGLTLFIIGIVLLSYFLKKKLQADKKNLSIGERFYKFIRGIGAGSFGSVNLYKCLQDKTNYVIKVIDLTGQDQKESEMVKREVRNHQNLRHANIVHMIEYKDENNTMLIVQEYAD